MFFFGPVEGVDWSPPYASLLHFCWNDCPYNTEAQRQYVADCSNSTGGHLAVSTHAPLLNGLLASDVPALLPWIFWIISTGLPACNPPGD